MSVVFIRPVGSVRFCRLLTIGTVSHITACLARIDATEHVELTSAEPPPELLCIACGADLAARRQRADTRDLRPYAVEVGCVAEMEVEVQR